MNIDFKYNTYTSARARVPSCRHYSSKHKLQIGSLWMLMTTFGRKMGDFRLPPRRRWYLRSSGILRSVEWQFRTEVSGRHINRPIGCPESR